MYIGKTRFSYRYGTFTSQNLVQSALQFGIDTLVLANRNDTADVWNFVKYCKQNNIKPIVGVSICNDDDTLYLLLAQDKQGLLSINQFLSAYHLQKKKFPLRAPSLPNCFIIYPYEHALNAGYLSSLSHQEYISVQLSDVFKLHRLTGMIQNGKVVWTHNVTFATQQDYNIHRLLRAVDHNTLLSKLPKSAIASHQEFFRPKADILSAFVAYPLLLSNTAYISAACQWDVSMQESKNKKTFTGDIDGDRAMVRRLTFEQIVYRYPQADEVVIARIEKELEIIDRLGFNAYFLIAWDVVRYARHRGFFYVGRGSGANSIVAYCLHITDVDPIELDLYFERFLNPYRTSPPDFDLDFSWKDRDEVIDYLITKYGKEYTCLLGAYATFQRAALCRQLGKVFGLPKEEIDKLSITPYERYSADTYHQLIKRYSDLMVDFPDHLSIHAGGVLISEEPICTYTALQYPPKGFPTAQLDMHIAEDIRLDKLDILSQRGLGHIKDAIALVKQNRNTDIDIHNITKLKSDPQLAQQIRNADTIGCFYIESPAMRQLLAKLRCDDYLTLVAASSIIRPGVSSSGMMRAYIERHYAPDQVQYLHPKMKELLEQTYGVMVYQEDVIKVAYYYGGIDMGEADILRRAMSGKYRGNKEMMRLQESFYRNCSARNYPHEISAEVWRQIASFAGYSFSKAHSASFAVESYQSLMLKTYYPCEFMVAVINNFGGFYNAELYFHELRRSGANIHLPCVNHSDKLTNIQGRTVYVGFIHIVGLQDSVIDAILKEREEQGPFLSLYDFIKRTHITKEQLNILITINALRFTKMSKQELLWEANCFQKSVSLVSVGQSSLFCEEPTAYTLPSLEHEAATDVKDELELLGFMLSDPYQWVKDDVSKYPLAESMCLYIGQRIEMLGYLVTIKFTKTKHKERMCFGTFLDPAGRWLDTVHFPKAYANFPFIGKGFYRMVGVVIEEFGVCSLAVEYMERKPMML